MTTRAHGFDTYVYEYMRDGQGKLIVPKLADLQGQIDFVIVQIYQRGFWKDFPLLWDNLASPCGIRGHYTYQVSGDSWLKQAEEVLAHTPGDCQFMVLDIEKTGNTVDQTMLADSSRILRYWKQERSDLTIMYYANPDMYVNYILPIMQKNYPQDKWYLDFDLWVSQWPWLKILRSPDNNPALPKNMRGDWKIYQYTDAGDKSLYSAADLDVFNGPVSSMRQWLGLDNIPQPEPTPLPSHVLELHHADNGTTESVSFDGVFHLDENVDYVAVDAVHFVTPTPAPTPEPEPTPGPQPTPTPDIQTVRFGIAKPFIIQNNLTLNGKYTPAVCQVNDRPVIKNDGSGRVGKGHAIPIGKLPFLQDYIREINNAAGARYALETVGAMWINSPGWGESIICQLNIVSWDPNDNQNDCAKLRCFYDNETFNFDPAQVNWYTRPDLFFKANALNLQGNFINVANNVDCFIPICACSKNSGGTGELWLALSEIEEFPKLPCDVTILPNAPTSHLNIHNAPDFDPDSIISNYVSGEMVTVYAYRPIGASVFGQTDRGWICLLQATKPGERNFMTSWKLQTEGVIPPQ